MNDIAFVHVVCIIFYRITKKRESVQILLTFFVFYGMKVKARESF